MRLSATKQKQSQCRWCDFRAWGKNYAEVDSIMGEHIMNNHAEEFRRWYDLPEAEGGPKERAHYKTVKSKVPVEEWNRTAAIMNSQLFDGMVKKIMEADQ